MQETILIVLTITVMMAALMLIMHRRIEPFYAPGLTAAKGNTIKTGNNGTVSCQAFCTGQWKGGSQGKCVRAYDNKTKKIIDCNKVRGIAGADVTCECGPKPKSAPAARHDVLDGNKCMMSGQSLVSPNKLYRAVMQDDGNFVVYERSKPIWSSHHGQTTTNSTIPISPTNKPYRLCIDKTGNMSVRDKHNKQVWMSDSGGKDTGPYVLTMQNDGHLLLHGKHVVVWGSKWTTRCANVLAWWKQKKNPNASNPWADYISRLQKKEFHVWPGPKCTNCLDAKNRYHNMYPDVGRGVDAALHASDHKNRVWQGMGACLPRPAAVAQKQTAKKVPTPAPPKKKPANVPPPPTTPTTPRADMLDDWQQCGGLGGSSGDTSDKPVVDGPWPAKRCKSGKCVKDNPWYYKCAAAGSGAPPPPTPTPTPSTQPPPPPPPPPPSGPPVQPPGSQEGMTTTYFDCCKPACGWPDKGSIPTCSKYDLTTRMDANAQSVCQGGDATTCAAQYPFILPEDPNTLYATVAAFNEGMVAGKCGKCFEVTWQGKDKHGADDGMGGKRMIAKVTNTGQDGEYQSGGHMDILLPGGGEGLFHGCSAGLYPQYGGYTVNGSQLPPMLRNDQALWDHGSRGNHSVWGLEYGGVQSMDGCSQLPGPFQEACRIKFGWAKGKLGAENKTWYREIECPQVLESRFR